MTIIDAIIQGIIQGLTEFLPVSSSGHLSLIQYFTGQSGETGALFSILLHLGTLLAVFIAFFNTIWNLIVEFFAIIRDIIRGRFTFRTRRPYRRMVFMLVLSLIPLVLALFLKDFYQKVSSDNDILVEGICFLVTSALLFMADACANGSVKASDMRPRDALAMGAMQAIAPLPGISRSGSTVAVGLMCGLDRRYALSFSFIMGVPAVLGANLLEIPDLIGQKIDISVGILITGLITSLIFGLLAIKMTAWLVRSNKFKYFAIYTGILGILTVIVGIVELISGHAIQQLVSSL